MVKQFLFCSNNNAMPESCTCKKEKKLHAGNLIHSNRSRIPKIESLGYFLRVQTFFFSISFIFFLFSESLISTHFFLFFFLFFLFFWFVLHNSLYVKRSLFRSSAVGWMVIWWWQGYTQRINTRQNTRIPRNALAAAPMRRPARVPSKSSSVLNKGCWPWTRQTRLSRSMLLFT